MLRDMLREAVSGLLAGVCLFAQSVLAEPINRAKVEAWLAAPPPVDLPVAGTQVSGADLENLRSLLPPGYFEFIADGDVPIEIQATGDYAPDEAYRAVTAANLGKASLRAGGGVDGYLGGQPFSNEQIAAAEPQQAGTMVAWNNVHRWQYYGYQVDAMDMIYVDPTAPGVNGTRVPGMEGGGNVQRSMVQSYHRVYLNHLAMLPE